MKQRIDVLTYGKDGINTSTFLSCEENPYTFSIDSDRKVHYTIRHPRTKESIQSKLWDMTYKMKEEHVREDGYFKVMIMDYPEDKSENGKCSYTQYMCTTTDHKVKWDDDYVQFEFNGIANEDPWDSKFVARYRTRELKNDMKVCACCGKSADGIYSLNFNGDKNRFVELPLCSECSNHAWIGWRPYEE